jgi:outer membrane protein
MAGPSLRLFAALALVSAVAGCSSLDLGPQPSDYVGSRGAPGRSLTDAELEAVTPIVSGNTAASALEFPASTLPAQGASPQTMPAATETTTTRPTASTNPATHAALGQGSSAGPSTGGPALGHVDVPQSLGVQDAILVGLQNNVNLHVQRYSVPLARTNEEAALAAFDPTLTGQVTGQRTANPSEQAILTGTGSGGTTVVGGGTQVGTRRVTTIIGQANGQIGVQEFLPTGTTIAATYSTNNVFYSDASANSSIGATVTQKLLRGFGLDVNLAQLRQAEVNTKITQFELRGFAEQLVASIEETYWDLAYDERQVVIVQNALTVAQAQLEQTQSLIQVGRQAPTEQAAAQAQVELEKEDLINAKSTLEEDRIKLLQLITPAGQPFWNRTISLQTLPFIPTGKMDSVESHAAVALKFRPEVNEAKLQIQNGDLSVVETKNGLLPELDFFVNLSKTGYASSFTPSNTDINGPGYNAEVGLSGSIPVLNLAARAAYRSAILTREQLQDSLNNLYQTVQMDVRTQYIEVERTRQQIDATRAAREAEEISLQVEQAKFQAGRSTSLLVAQAQQLLLSAQLTEVQAVTGHLKSLVELYRLEGSLLYRRGLDAPGAKPIDHVAWH